jgi:diketogulonate reductase-like aldo/keto reductase
MEKKFPGNIPNIGIGTRKDKTKPEDIRTAIVDYNYRLIDTASFYEVEEEVGEGIKAAGEKVPRNDIFVSSKIWNDQKDNVEGALRESLKRLQLDHLDLYLIHWPMGVCVNESTWKYKQRPMHEVWADMETCVRKGLTKHIGVSNFHVQLLLDILSYAEIPPFANEVELHPYCAQRKLVKYCLLNKIRPIAYGPLTAPGQAPVCVIEDHTIKDLAEKYKKTPGQICLQWGMANGHVVIPQTNKPKRMEENMDSTKFKIEEDDLKKIDGLDKAERIYDPHMRKEFGGVPIFD